MCRIFGYRRATQGLKPRPCFGQQLQFYCPVQDKGKNEHRLVLEPFIGNCNRANPRYSHCYCIIKQVKTIRIESHEITVYTLFRTERIKPMPCPAAHPGTTSSLRWSRKREAREKRPGDEVDPRINRQRAFSIINRAPKGTCVYSDNKDYTAAINDSTMDVELQRKFSFDYRGVTVVKFVPLDKVIFNASFSFKPSFLAFFLLASYLSTLQKLCLDSQSQEKGQFPCLAH